jgi:hypothetical protein
MVSNTLKMSSNKSRLDISPVSATKKKPWCEAPGLYYFQTEPGLPERRAENNKARSSAQRCKAFSLLSTPKTDHKIILPLPSSQ